MITSKDENITILENLIKGASNNWASAAAQFWSPDGNNGFNERNITTYLHAEAVKSGAHVYCEIPTPNKKSGNLNARIDSLILLGDCLYIVEAKRVYNIGGLRSILRDVDRLHQKEVLRNILSKDKWWGKTPPPKQIYWLAICEIWDEGKKKGAPDNKFKIFCPDYTSS